MKPYPGKIKLYHYVHCPFCVRVRLALGFLNIPFESHVIAYDDEEKVTELYDVITHKLMKRLPHTKVLTCDNDSKWLYCS